jgi:hypothetical protein
MSFAIFKGEKTIKELVSRLFKLPAQTPKSTIDQAAAALLAANPQLKNISKVRVGSVIKIPPTAPPLHPAENAATPVSRVAALALQAQSSLNAIHQQLAQTDTRASSAANQFLSLVQSPKGKLLLDRSTELKEQLPALVESVQQTVQSMKSSNSTRLKGMPEMTTALQAFARR